MDIIKQIAILKPELNDIVGRYKPMISEIQEKVEMMIKVVSAFDHNWVGQWASRNYNYYRDFINESGNNLSLTEDDIKEYVQIKCNVTFREIEDAIPEISKSYRTFQEKFITEMSVIKGINNLDAENDLLNNLEKHKWGISPMEYIRTKRPQTVITYNPESLLNKGLDTPPHIIVGGTIISFFTILCAFEDFQKNCQRLLRQLELKFSKSNYKTDTVDSIVKIINSFHKVAIQLRNRYDNRDSIIINDEYDVQDLLIGLLRIEFDDIRPEEHTPSYAGSSTRMDFLLKEEQIVIEVKKTRHGLKDKEVGDQLIIDTLHYKSHPDCKRLICFVYDPENKIKNPRGLESDLAKLTTEEMSVEVYIRP